MRHLGVILLVVVLAGTAPAFSATALEETRRLEQLASRDPRQAIDEAQQRLRQGQAVGDKAAQLQALRQLAMAHDQIEDNPGLREAARDGLELARALNDTQAQAEFMAAEAAAAANEGRNRDSLRLFDLAAAFAEQHRLERDLAKIYVGKAHTLSALERESEALVLLQRALPLFELQNDRLWMSNALSDVANIYASDTASKDELRKALTYHQRAIDLIDPRENRHELSSHYHNLGIVHYRLKDYERAKQFFEKSRAIARELKDPNTEAFIDYRLGIIAADERRLDEAMTYFDRALPVMVQAEKVSMQFNIHLGRAKTLASLARRKDALVALAAAQPLAKRIGSPKRDAQYFETSAEVYARLGDYEKAYWELGDLRDADRRTAATNNARLAAEQQALFDAKQRETDNALLRMEQQEQEARGLALILALALSLVIVGGLAIYLVRQSRQNRRFANLAMRDDLTGLPNRRSILEFASLQFKGRRSGDRQGFCVALIDIDHFKAINDEFGHSVGDAVLVAFAQACQRSLRANDRMGRFGGEEFMVVMPGSTAARISAVFSRLREATGMIEAAGFPQERRITFSLGGTEARDGDPSLDAVIKRADEALYSAKNAGRDRFEIS